MEKLTWYFELLDKVSGPAKRMESQLKHLRGAMAHLERSGSGMGRVFSRVGASVSSMRQGLGAVTSGLGGMGSMMAGVVGVGAVGGLAYAGAKWAIDAVNFRESTMVAFETMLGTHAKAKEMMDRAVKFAAKTPFATNEVIDMTKRLLVSGFKANEIDPMMLGIGDVGFILGKDKIDPLITAFAKIRSQGKLTGESLEMLTNNGVNGTVFFANLGKQLGVTAEKAREMMSAGKITGDMPIVAALETIKTEISGGKLGAGMEKAAGSLGGLWSTLTSRPGELMLAFNDIKGAGDPLAKIKAIIVDLTNTLDPAGPTGKRILGLFALISGGLDRMLGSAMKGRSVEDILGGILNVVEPLVKFMMSFGEGMFAGLSAGLKPLMDVLVQLGDDPQGVAKFAKNIFELGAVVGRVTAVFIYGFGAIAASLGAGLSVAGAFYGTLMQIFDQLGGAGMVETVIEKFVTFGARIVEGLWAGITGGWGAMLMKFAGLVDLLPASVRTALGIASPSKVMEQLGRNTGEGFALGLDRGGMNDTIAVPSVGSMAGAGGGSRVDMGGISVTVNVSGAKDPAAIGGAVAEAIEERLASLFGQLSLATGT